MTSPQVVINLDSDTLEPLIRQIVEEVLTRQRDLSATGRDLDDQLMHSEPQAARKLGMTPVALRDERLRGRIGYVKRGRQVRYLPEHLLDYVASWEQSTDSGD